MLLLPRNNALLPSMPKVKKEVEISSFSSASLFLKVPKSTGARAGSQLPNLMVCMESQYPSGTIVGAFSMEHLLLVGPPCRQPSGVGCLGKETVPT